MGVLTDLIIASCAEADEVVQAAGHAERWPTLDMKGFSPISLGVLLSILHSEMSPVDFDMELLAAGDMEEGPWVTGVSSAFVEAVAAMQMEQLSIAADKLADSEELSDWSPGEVGEKLKELRSFCAQAQDANTTVLMWSSL